MRTFHQMKGWRHSREFWDPWALDEFEEKCIENEEKE